MATVKLTETDDCLDLSEIGLTLDEKQIVSGSNGDGTKLSCIYKIESGNADNFVNKDVKMVTLYDKLYEMNKNNSALIKPMLKYCMTSETDRLCGTDPKTGEVIGKCPVMLSDTEAGKRCQRVFRRLTDADLISYYDELAQDYCSKDANKNKAACHCLSVGTNEENPYYKDYQDIVALDPDLSAKSYCWFKPCLVPTVGQIGTALVSKHYYDSESQCDGTICSSLQQMLGDNQISSSSFEQNVSCLSSDASAASDTTTSAASDTTTSAASDTATSAGSAMQAADTAGGVTISAGTSPERTDQPIPDQAILTSSATQEDVSYIESAKAQATTYWADSGTTYRFVIVLVVLFALILTAMGIKKLLSSAFGSRAKEAVRRVGRSMRRKFSRRTREPEVEEPETTQIYLEEEEPSDEESQISEQAGGGKIKQYRKVLEVRYGSPE